MMKKYILPSVKLSAVFILLCAGIYPLLIAAVGLLAPGGGNGEKIMYRGRVVGYACVGQRFTRDEYFWGRPSAVDYNAAGSAGSNKGPSDSVYLQTVQARIDTFLRHNPAIEKSAIPSELVTASGSGLDPHISVQAAKVQVPRIAKARQRSEQEIYRLVEQHIEKPLLGLFGPARINVLRLNIALNTL